MHKQTALQSLTKNRNIVIRPSDKNGSIVALDKEEYENLNKHTNTSCKEEINLQFIWIYERNSKPTPWKPFT